MCVIQVNPSDADRVPSQVISHLNETRITYRYDSGTFFQSKPDLLAKPWMGNPKEVFSKYWYSITDQLRTFKEIVRKDSKKNGKNV